MSYLSPLLQDHCLPLMHVSVRGTKQVGNLGCRALKNTHLVPMALIALTNLANPIYYIAFFCFILKLDRVIS